MSPLAIVLMHKFGSKAIVSIGLLVMAAGFLIAATIEVDTPYFGAVIISMVVIAAGLGLATSPATEAIMGALPAEQAGAGSAVNDTTRELGGTLGVAIVGSVFLSVYGAKVVEGYRSLGLPEQYESVVRDSMGGGLGVASSVARRPRCAACVVRPECFHRRTLTRFARVSRSSDHWCDRGPEVPACPCESPRGFLRLISVLWSKRRGETRFFV
jgi:MFS family permease